jgi:plastocyanin
MGFARRFGRAGVRVLALAGLALAGCSSDSKSSDTPAAATTTTAAVAPTTSAAVTTAAVAPADGAGIVIIKDFQFEIPSGLKAGDTVTITNEDSVQHTFSDQAGTFSIAADPATPAELTLPAAGTYTVVCNIHTGMTGTLTVG